MAFHSALVPPYVRKTRSLEAALPWLHLKGISSGEMGEALGCRLSNLDNTNIQENRASTCYITYWLLHKLASYE